MKTNTHPASHSVLESLEPRLAPAGTLTLTTAGGVLTITGDLENNGIEIVDVPGTGSWQINNFGGLTTTFELNGVDMAAGFTIPAQTAIKANLGDGNDEMLILPSSTPSSMLVPGGITINAGKGNDEVYLGTSSPQQLMMGGLSVDLGEGNDTFDATLSATYSGAVKVVGGLGNDTVRFEGVSAEQVFLKGLTVDVGKGDNLVVLDSFRLAVLGALNVIDTGEAGLSPLISVGADTLTVDGSVSFSVALGNSSISIGNETTDVQQFGAGLKITGGTGNDTVSFRGIQTIVGGVSVNLKGGNNSTSFADGSSFAAASLAILGTTGTDNVLLANNTVMTVNGAFSMNLGNGVNKWEASAGVQLTAGSVSYLGGINDDTVDYVGASLRVLGAMSINVGTDGANNVDLSPTGSAYVGGLLTLTGGKGNDVFDLVTPDFRIVTGLKAVMGHGNNELNTSGALLQIAGGLNFAGGTGVDRLIMENDSLVVARTLQISGGGSTGLELMFIKPGQGSIGAVNFKGGAGRETLALGNDDGTSTTRLSIHGNISANYGTGTSRTFITDCIVQGTVTVVASSIATEVDDLFLKQSSFNGAVNITFGAGNGTTDLNDLFVRSNFTMNAGAGNDLIRLETLTGTAAESHWFGLVKISGGAGDDTLSIGPGAMTANAVNNFYKNIVIDGGVGNDTMTTALPGFNTFHAGATNSQINFP